MADSAISNGSLNRHTPPVRRAITAERAAYEHYGLDPTDHYFDITELDCRIRVAEVGDGPPLVLINGGEGKGMMWLPLLPELDDYTLYVMDRPGGGLSDPFDHRSLPLRQIAASSTRGLFEYFDLEAAPVIGNSMGGLWTLRFALEHPDLVSAIGLLGCPALYPDTSAPLPMRLGSLSVLSEFVVENMMQADSPEEVREGWKFLGQPPETRENLPEEFAEAWYRMDSLPTYKHTWIGLLQSGLRLRGADPDAAFTTADLQSIQAPVTLLWGNDDPFGSVETGRAGAKHFQNSEFHIVGVGHLPWLDDPEACGTYLREFIETHG